MKRLFYGGSFNPIHYGHLRCAQAVAQSQGFDRVVLIPSGRPPHKLDALNEIAGGADRLAMCRLAIEGSDLFEVDDREIRQPGASYTLLTVRSLKQQVNGPIRWLIGADQLVMLPTWYEVEKLLHEVSFVIMARPGWSFGWETLPPIFHKLQANVVEAPRVDISGTEIRRRVREGKSIDGLTPPAVVTYIQSRNLYR